MYKFCILGYGLDTSFCWDRFNAEKCKSFLERISKDNASDGVYENIDDFIAERGLANTFKKCDKSGLLSSARTESSEYLYLESLLPWEVADSKRYNELTAEMVEDIIVDAIQTLTNIPRNEIILGCEIINDIEDY